VTNLGLLSQLAEERPSDKEPLPDFGVGDTVRLMLWISEGSSSSQDSWRLQPFEGTIIRMKSGQAANFTVRRVQRGFGVERTIPLSSPRLESLSVTRKGKVRRSRLYYLRGRTGRAARVKEANRS